jgi:hypothetical protein
MASQDGKEKKSKKGVSRREFIKTTATVGTATIVGAGTLKAAGSQSAAEWQDLNVSAEPGSPPDLGETVELASVHELDAGQEFAVRASFPIGNPGSLPHVRTPQEQAMPRFDRHAVLFALGDTLIPSAPGDPGFRDLEWYGITEEVSRRLQDLADEDLAFFNKSSVAVHEKPFAELPESKRAEYIREILKANASKDEGQQKKLKDTYNHARELIFTVYYQNFPEDHWPRDAHRVPLLHSGDQHQITNPNTRAVVTGWDVTGYSGPLTWEEEERRRNFFKKIRWEHQ